MPTPSTAAPSASLSAAERSAHRRAWIALAIVCVVWGTTYLAIKIALETIPPFLMGGVRYSIAGLALAAILASRGHPLPPPRDWGTLAVLGFFMLMFGNGGVVWGEQYIPSGLTAVLIATSPFWMVSVDAIVTGGKQLFVRQWAGLIVGFAGIVMLVWPDIRAGGAGGRGFLWGVISVQLACAGWAVGSSYTRRHVVPRDILGAAALQMIFGGIFLTIAGSLTGEWAHFSFSSRTAVALAYLVVMGSLVAYAAYSYALSHLEITVVSLYTYVNPVIAVALGTLLLGEPFDLRMLAAIAIITLGVVIVGPFRK